MRLVLSPLLLLFWLPRALALKNIGINNNRERGEGTLKIEFYDEAAMTAAWKRLEYYKYEMVRL